MRHLMIILASVLLMIACKENQTKEDHTKSAKTSFKHSKAIFGEIEAGVVDLYTLENPSGMRASITTYGGILQSLLVPDRNGNLEDVVLGFDSLESYTNGHPYFGAIVGRYANRIADAKFVLDGKTYTLAKNNGSNHIHGGIKGFDKFIWNTKTVQYETAVGLELTRTSADLEEGYPGKMELKVTYWLTNDNELRIEYEARSDKNTVCNLTHHSYFNLSGNASRDILAHELMLKAKAYIPIDETSIPTGEIATVAATPFDFNKAMTIGSRIDMENEQLSNGIGYDHSWVLDSERKQEESIASLYDPISGRFMEVSTLEPGIQIYTGNYLNKSFIGKGNKPYRKRLGVCFETQHYPDSPNQPHFPSTTLKAGELYQTWTTYRFSVK